MQVLRSEDGDTIKYLANSGEVFDSEGEALADDNRDAIQSRIEGYIAQAEGMDGRGNATRARNMLSDYESWLTTQVSIQAL